MKEAENNSLEMTDFSVIEDSAESFEIIRYLAKNAGKNASAEAIAEGLARVYINDHGTLEKIAADGKKTTLASTHKKTPYFIKYNSSKVLYADK